MSGQIYKVTIELPLLARANSAEELRRQLANMTIEDVIHEVNEGADMIGGNRAIKEIEHVPAEEVENELLAVGNDGTFFEDDMDDWLS